MNPNYAYGITEDYDLRTRFPTATPSPSPRRPSFYHDTPPRPATRPHFRDSSYNDFSSPRPPTSSPRYTSDGYYATVNLSSARSSAKPSRSNSHSKRSRRTSLPHHRASDPFPEFDAEVFIHEYVPYATTPKRPRASRYSEFYTDHPGEPYSDHPSYMQGGYSDRDGYYPYKSERPSHSPRQRRSSGSAQRTASARPTSSHKKSNLSVNKATEEDARRYRIPLGYSLKNWDPNQEPILLLGSVFDANSLGKWIYDWTVYHHGPSRPISEMAGDLWLLLIQLAGKIQRAENSINKIRRKESREMLEDFIESGQRLTDKLRKLLKACEAPMLKASKRSDSQLGNNSGVEFVETLFGRGRELQRTERFMASLRVWIFRFEANCEDIMKRPTI